MNLSANPIKEMCHYQTIVKEMLKEVLLGRQKETWDFEDEGQKWAAENYPSH